MKNKLKYIAGFVILVLLLFTNNIFAADWTLVEVVELPVGFRFEYGNYSAQNFLATDVFMVQHNTTGQLQRTYCIQQRVLTEAGTQYDLTEYNYPVSLSQMRLSDQITPYALGDGGNTADHYYLNVLNEKIRKSFNIAYMWERMYYPDEQPAMAAAAWFIWCQGIGWASEYMEGYRANSKYPNGLGVQIEDGYWYLDMEYGTFDNDDNNNGIFSDLGLKKPGNIHTHYENGVLVKETSWDFEVAEQAAQRYIELINYYQNFNDTPANLSRQSKVLFPGESFTYTDSSSVVKVNPEWTLDTSDLPQGITAQIIDGGVKVDVSNDFKGYFKGIINLKRFEKNNPGKIGVYSNGAQQILYHGALPIQSYDLELEVASGKIRITKEDNETGAIPQGNARLEGAQYEVRKSDGTYSKVLTIGEDLKAETDWIGLGTYYVREIKAPTGYELSNTVYTVEVTTFNIGNVYIDIKVGEDVIRGNIQINKSLSATAYDDEINLAGAQFKATLKSDSSKVYYSNISGADGICIIQDLPYGTYIVEESIVPPSALKVDNFEATVQESKKTYTYEIEDPSKLAVLKIRKVDADRKDTDAPDYTQGDAELQGAQYTLYRDENLTQVIDIITIDHKDSEGYWCGESEPTRTGTYYLKETKAAEGRLLDPNVYVYALDNTKQTEHIIYPSKTSSELVMRGSIEVIKFDDVLGSTEEKASEGAVLRLTLDSDSSKYYELTIDENGYGEFVEEESREKYYPYTIPYGDYTITEQKASNTGEHTHYFFYPEKVTIAKDLQKEYRIFADIPVEMYLQIEKIDKDTNSVVGLAGARYKVWNCQTNSWVSQKIYPSGEYIDEFETNEEGKLTLPDKIQAGEYIIYETKAPDGYYLDDEWRIPTNEADIGNKDKGGKYIRIDKNAMGMEESSTPGNVDLYYKAEMPNTPLKGKLEIFKTGEKLSDVSIEPTIYGEKITPVYKNEGLAGVTYQIKAAEDIKSPDGRVTYVQKGTIVDTITTGEDGIATTKDLYLGEYEIKEIITPIGYIKDDNIENVVLENENSLVKVETVNKELNNVRQKLKLTFIKEYKEASKYMTAKDDTRWAVFGVYANEDIRNPKGSIVIAKDSLLDVIRIEGENVEGTSNIDLPEGKYYIKELAVSYQYKINPDPMEITLQYVANNVPYITVELESAIINEPTDSGNITLIKVSSSSLGSAVVIEGKIDDETTDEALKNIMDELKGMTEDEVKSYLENNDIKTIAGVKYSIYIDKDCTKPLYEKDAITGESKEVVLVTDESGFIKLEEIPLGKYYLKEIEAPENYVVSGSIVEVDLTLLNKDGTVYQVLSNDSVVREFINKTDIFTGEVVPNCVFEIRDENGKVLLHSITDENGIAYIPLDIFEDGKTYTYTEIDAPEIYNLNTKSHEFIAEFDEEGNWITETIAVENIRNESKVTFLKLDFNDSTPIPNCKFELRSLETDFVVEGVTDENGICVFENVPYGKYTYQEVEAPEGYIMDTEVYEITIDAEEIELQITNEKKVEPPATGDMSVATFTSIFVMSALGIAYVLKAKKQLVK